MNNIPSKKISRITAAVLTVAFLGFIFVAFFAMVTGNTRDLAHSIQMTADMKKTLPRHPSRLDRLAARISGFTSTVSEIMWHKDEMGYINSAFQYGLGKRVINTGSQNMITLADGHLYDLASYKDLSENAREIAQLRRTTLGDIPFLFTYEHPTLYDQSLLPAGYEALDHSARMAGEAVATLRGEGIRVLDSRDTLSLLAVDLHTGRTHQIRAQLSHRRHPIVGDRRYGAPKNESGAFGLLSYSLSFPHPTTGEKMRFRAKIPNSYPWVTFELSEQE